MNKCPGKGQLFPAPWGGLCASDHWGNQPPRQSRVEEGRPAFHLSSAVPTAGPAGGKLGAHRGPSTRRRAGDQGDGACHTRSPVPGTQRACSTNARCGSSPWLGSSDNFSSFCSYICFPAASFHLSCSSPHGRSGGLLSPSHDSPSAMP